MSQIHETADHGWTKIWLDEWFPLPQNQRRSNGVVVHWSNHTEQNP